MAGSRCAQAHDNWHILFSIAGTVGECVWELNSGPINAFISANEYYLELLTAVLQQPLRNLFPEEQATDIEYKCKTAYLESQIASGSNSDIAEDLYRPSIDDRYTHLLSNDECSPLLMKPSNHHASRISKLILDNVE